MSGRLRGRDAVVESPPPRRRRRPPCRRTNGRVLVVRREIVLFYPSRLKTPSVHHGLIRFDSGELFTASVGSLVRLGNKGRP